MNEIGWMDAWMMFNTISKHLYPHCEWMDEIWMHA
jgi:hypothetical protein